MSYPFINFADKLGRGELNLATTTGFYMGLAMEGSGLTGTGQPSATALSAVTTLTKCTYANYVMKNLSGLTYTVDTTANVGRFRFTPVTWTALGSGALPIVGAWLQWGSSTTTGRPLAWFDNTPTFPFTGGRDVIIASLTAGSVKIGG